MLADRNGMRVTDGGSMILILLITTSSSIMATDAKEGAYSMLSSDDEMWTNYKTQFGKLYTDELEDAYRRSVWLQNVHYINKHNLEVEFGRHSFTLGVNNFADLTVAEYRKILLGVRGSMTVTCNSTVHSACNVCDMAPDSVNWKAKGYVTDVKDQKLCGSCWAFSATGALEGQHFKKTGQLVSLSEQNLIDCSGSYGNDGCNGGWPLYAFDYVIGNEGINTEKWYPYEGFDGPCRFDSFTVGATCTGYKCPIVGDENDLKQAVASIGPISVCIDAGQETFQFYKSGVYDEPNCTPNVDHAVLVAGYGTYRGLDYWLVKNSWNATWGMDGYIMMSRNKENQCGIASYAIYPTM